MPTGPFTGGSKREWMESRYSNDYESLIWRLRRVSLAMFRKNFMGIFHGSISARVELNKFVINKKDAIFDDLSDEDFVLLYHNRDYRWKEASLDSDIHSAIYSSIKDAKFIAYAMPPFTTAYSLENDYIIPLDYFGKLLFPKIKIYDPKHYEDWYDRADVEISRYFHDADVDVMVIRGYGVYGHAREINRLAKNLAVVENSCRLLLYNKM